MSDQIVDLRPKAVHIKVRRGDAWSLRVSQAGTDLTGATIAAQLRTRADAEDAVDLDIADTDLAAGVFHVGQRAATISGVYDVQVTPADGLPRTLIAGRITVDADVTR